MDAYKAIITKRDRREYDSRPLPEEALHRILQAGRMAGSSSNSQPVRYIVLQDRERMKSLMQFGRGTGNLEKAPLAIVTVLTEGGGPFDVGRALQNMMVAAWADGIISCPVGFQDREGIKQALGIPDGYTVSTSATFGYPAEGSAPSAGRGKRLPLEEIVHRERW